MIKKYLLQCNKVLLLILIISLGFFLRFYKLDQFPIHLGHDEVSQLYDAISIAETGRDIYGNSYPFIFQSVNDFKAPFYTYATALIYHIFGWKEVTSRIIGALFGTMLIFGVFLFVDKFLKSKKIALLAAFLTAISPFEVFYSRKSFENQAGIFLMLVSFALLLASLENKKKKLLYLSFLFLGLAAYVYFAQAALIPLLLIVFTTIFFEKIKSIDPKVVIFFILIVTPLSYIIYVNPDTRNRSNAVFITQDPRLGERIKDETNYLTKVVYVGGYSAARYLNQFNPKYLFFEGLNMTDGKRDVGLLFATAIPFLIIGIYILAKDRSFTREKLFILAWILIGMIPSGLTFEDYSPHRSLMTFTMLNVVIAAGVHWFYQKFGVAPLIIIIFLFALNFGFFIKRYTVNFPIERSEKLQYPYREVSQFAWANYESFDQIIFDPKFGEFAPWIGTGAHYYLGFYGNYPPEKMQSEFKIGDQSKRETKFDKFKIRAVYFPEDMNLTNTLIIASRWSLPLGIEKEANIIKTFYFRTTAPAFYAIKL